MRLAAERAGGERQLFPRYHPAPPARTPAGVKAWRTRRARAEQARIAAGGAPIAPVGGPSSAKQARWAEQEKALVNTPVVKVGTMPKSKKGVSESYFITFSDGTKGVYKKPLLEQSHGSPRGGALAAQTRPQLGRPARLHNHIGHKFSGGN